MQILLQLGVLSVLWQFTELRDKYLIM